MRAYLSPLCVRDGVARGEKGVGTVADTSAMVEDKDAYNIWPSKIGMRFKVLEVEKKPLWGELLVNSSSYILVAEQGIFDRFYREHTTLFYVLGITLDMEVPITMIRHRYSLCILYSSYLGMAFSITIWRFGLFTNFYGKI